MSAAAEWQRIREANAVRHDRERLEAKQAQVELAANATEETLRHRRMCVIDEMWTRDKLTSEQRQAALEIAAVWMSITAGLFAKVQKYERHIAGSSQEDWRVSVITAYQSRYIPWRDEAGAVSVGRGSLTLADLVFKLAVDNYGIRQTADSYRMDQRTVLNHVRVSLLRYAEIGGWVDHLGRPKKRA